MISTVSRTVAAFLLTFLATRSGRGQGISEFPTGPQLLGEMIGGPDGNLYFGGGRVTLDGTVTPLIGPQDCGLSPLGFPAQGVWMENLAFGGDGSLWFAMPCGSNQFPPYPPLVRSVLGRIASDGVHTTTIDGQVDLIGLPDGNVWAGFGADIGLVQSDLSITWASRPTTLTGGRLAVGPDGNVWFLGASRGLPILGTIASGRLVVVANLPADAQPSFLTLGADGNFWMTGVTQTSPSERVKWVARCSPTGAFKQFNLPSQTQASIGPITAGPDGNLWFTEPGSNQAPGNKIARAQPDGTITEFTTPSPNSMPYGIAAGGDGNIWFAEPGAQRIGRRNLAQSASCVATATALCLSGARFRVEAQWRRAGAEQPLSGNAVGMTSETGYFWFLEPDNVEVVAKVLNGCSGYGHYWFFAGGLTNLEVTITVTDTQTHAVMTYTNQLGTAFQPIQDTKAFATCP